MQKQQSYLSPATPTPSSRRRLSDILSDMDFVEVQLEAIQRPQTCHKTSKLVQRISALHRRLDYLEDLVRVHARVWGEDPMLPNGTLRRHLRDACDRGGPTTDGSYAGPERRNTNRPHLSEPPFEPAALLRPSPASFSHSS